jgi:recombination protein RecT
MTAPTKGTALTKVDVLRQTVEPMAPEIQAVAFKMFTPERIFASLFAAAAKDPNLFDADKKTLYLALMKVARWGLDIGDGVDLVVIGGKVDAWPDYRGLKALAIRQGLIRNAEEFVVYEGETYRYEAGLNPILQHQPLAGSPNRKIVAAYSIITLPRGLRTFNWMWIQDVERIRAKSRSWGPSKSADCPPWYAKKTVIRDYLNRQPKSGALAEAMAHDDTVDMETGEVVEGGATDARD